MEAKAQVRYLRMSPMKARRVVDLIRGKSTAEALDTLRFAPQAASEPVAKLFDESDLVISSAFVDEGPTMKRFQPRAQGRAFQIKKRTSHVTVVVAPVNK